MDFLNKLGDLANKAGKKTGDFTKEAKIKMKMSDNKSKIEDLYKKIGKAIYQEHIDIEESKKEEIADCCIKIDELSKEIENYQDEIRKLKNKRVCEKCFTEIDMNVKYCPNCGAEQPEPPKEEVMEAEIVEEDNKAKAEAEEVKEENTEEVNNQKAEELQPEQNNQETVNQTAEENSESQNTEGN